MERKIRILAFAGSTRAGSYNKQLIRIAARNASEAGAEVTLIDLRDLPMPLYDGDLEKEKGIPENAMKFRMLLKENQGLLISSPEYNSSISGVLKNSIDWASRPLEGEPQLACFVNKTAGLMSTSTGALGGLRGLVALRSMLGNIKVLVLPEQVSVPRAKEAFDENGNLKDAKHNQSIEALSLKLVKIIEKIGH
jgi:chromate reductase, NAD(P)H dehydrogenase (quinone)